MVDACFFEEEAGPGRRPEINDRLRTVKEVNKLSAAIFLH